MTVLVRPLSAVTAGINIPANSQVKSFTDNFTRANAGNLGSQWATVYVSTTNPPCSLNCGINANRGRFFQNGSAGTVRTLIYPLGLSWMTQAVQNQFSEGIVTANSAIFSWELLTVMSPNFSNTTTAGWYGLSWSGTTITIVRAVYNGVLGTGITQNTLSNLGGATAALGDTLRLQAVNVAGTWTLSAFKNGVLVGSITDFVLPQGQPAIDAVTATAGTTVDMSIYNAGKL